MPAWALGLRCNKCHAIIAGTSSRLYNAIPPPLPYPAPPVGQHSTAVPSTGMQPPHFGAPALTATQPLPTAATTNVGAPPSHMVGPAAAQVALPPSSGLASSASINTQQQLQQQAGGAQAAELAKQVTKVMMSLCAYSDVASHGTGPVSLIQRVGSTDAESWCEWAWWRMRLQCCLVIHAAPP